MKLFVNALCQDIDRVCGFDAALLALPKTAASRSPIDRALDTGVAELGFNAATARALLGLEGAAAGTRCFATLLVDAPGTVDVAAEAAGLGRRVVKPPCAPCHGKWQVVLADPEGHDFRLSCLRLPQPQPT